MTPPSPAARLLAWGPALFGMAALFWSSSLPGDSIHLPDFRFSDKVVHFLAYAALGCLIALRHPLRRFIQARQAVALAAVSPGGASVPPPATPARLPADWLGAAAGILYGLSDEIHQMFVPMREPAVSDFTADALGILAGLWLVRRFARGG